MKLLHFYGKLLHNSVLELSDFKSIRFIKSFFIESLGASGS